MDTVSELAPAKLNLSLDVLARRADGYHEMKMVMASVTLCDEVSVSLRRDGQSLCESSLTWLPRDGRNLALRAADAFFSALGEENPGVSVYMRKRIPVGAGMAGGSADAAAVLRALNRLTGAGLDADALRRAALAVGSDVPYCVSGGMALAQGRGEILTPLPPLPPCGIVICKPAFSVSTPELFGRIGARARKTHPDTAGLIDALERQDLGGAARRMYNVFEDVLPRGCAEIGEIRSSLLDNGALGAVMTGTGSAVFGVFADYAAAQSAYEALKGRYRDCFLTEAHAAPYFD